MKTAKRLLLSNTGPTGSLDPDRFLRVMLQLRNTPDPDCNLSPAQIIFGRPLRDSFSFVNRLEKFSNHTTQPPLPASLHASHALYTFTVANSFTATYQQC